MMSFAFNFFTVTLFCVCIPLAIAKSWTPRGRIVGGSSAVKNQFKYQVSLRLNANDTHFCGGAIIDSRHIITAAHCFFNRPNHTEYFYGAINMTDVNELAIRVKFRSIIFYPEVFMRGPTPDIALIRTVRSITFSECVKPINFPTQKHISPGTVAIVSGWGLAKVRF